MIRRQIQWFIELPPRAYVKCLMCGEFDPDAWLMRKTPLDLAKHCPAHAEEFHALMPLQP